MTRSGPTRRVLVAAVVVAAGLTGGAPISARAATAPCHPPRCFDVAVPLPAGVHVPVPKARVLLPPGYGANPTACYPVLYLLHGAGDHYFTWSEKTDLVSYTAGFPANRQVIIVMPDGGHDGGSSNPNPAGWYSDWFDGSRQFETFHLGALLDWVDAHLRTRGKGHRAIAGLSMGGFGAMSYAARHRGLFQAAASFSGAVDMTYGAPASGLAFTQMHDQFGTPDRRVWGDQQANGDRWRDHNPTDRAASFKGTGIDLLLASGDGTPGGPAGDDPSNPGGYMLEQFIFQMNLSFTRALTRAGVPYHADLYGGGYHGWPYWQMDLHRAFPRLLGDIGGSAPC